MSYSKESNEDANKVWMVYYDAWVRKRRGGCVIPGNLDRIIHSDNYKEDILLIQKIYLCNLFSLCSFRPEDIKLLTTKTLQLESPCQDFNMEMFL